MTTSRSPAFQFYPDKWMSHTQRLSPAAYQVYHRLLCWMWQSAPDYCSIESAPAAIACAISMSVGSVVEAMVEIQNPYSPLLKLEAGRLISFGLRKEANKQAERREKARRGGYARQGHRPPPAEVEEPSRRKRKGNGNMGAPGEFTAFIEAYPNAKPTGHKAAICAWLDMPARPPLAEMIGELNTQRAAGVMLPTPSQWLRSTYKKKVQS